jgi:hypothetical protein
MRKRSRLDTFVSCLHPHILYFLMQFNIIVLPMHRSPKYSLFKCFRLILSEVKEEITEINYTYVAFSELKHLHAKNRPDLRGHILSCDKCLIAQLSTRVSKNLIEQIYLFSEYV